MLCLLEVASLGPALADLDSGQQSLSDATRALGSSPGQWTLERIASADPLGREATRKLVAGRDRLKRDSFLSALRPLPFIGNQVNAMYHLGDAGVAAGDGFAQLVTVARSYQAARSDTSPPGQRLLTLLGTSSGPLTAASATIHPALVALEGDLGHALLPPLRSKISEGVRVLAPADSQAAAGSAVGKYLPPALGAAGPRTYLILLANPAELRPAGGLAGAVGTVTFDRGAPTALQIRNEGDVNAKVKRHFDIPYPLERYFKFQNNSLELSDATWDPDFPASAALAEQIYAATGLPPVDGTISIDPYAIAAMLKNTGPVDVPPYGSFDSENFFTRIDHIVNLDTSASGGKPALGPIAEAVLRRVLAQPVSDWPSLLSVFQEQARSRHLQFAIHDPQLAAAAHSAGYDGALVQGHPDYLLAVDGNVGATKGDYYMTKTMSVKVELPGSGVSRHEVLLDYDLPLPRDSDDRGLNSGPGQYLDYLRVYLPETAHLAGFHFTEDGRPSTDGGFDRLTFEHGRTAVGINFRLPRGHRVQVRLDYEVPLSAGNSYELYVQKQAGIPSRPTTVEYSYPGGRGHQAADLAVDADFKVQW